MFEVFDFGECLVADAEALGDFVGFGGLRLGVLAEHVEVYGDDGVLIKPSSLAVGASSIEFFFRISLSLSVKRPPFEWSAGTMPLPLRPQ